MLWSHQSCLWVCASSAEFAIGGLSRFYLCTGCSALSLQLHRAESGSLTCLIAFDSSLSSPADQWSSVLFIRNINVPHIPTGSAANPLSPVWGWRFIFLRSRSSLTLADILFSYGECGWKNTKICCFFGYRSWFGVECQYVQCWLK